MVDSNTGSVGSSAFCPPALIYLAFSFTQILIDLFKGMYNVAFFKFLTMIIFSLLLNILCQQGLGIISWTIVFVPFMLMSIITAILLFVFGLDPTTGRMKYDYKKMNGHSKHHRKDPRPRRNQFKDEINYNTIRNKLDAVQSKQHKEKPKHRKHHEPSEYKNEDNN